ncbi:DUF4304 domain-containing protein [Anderseniella sp. Alg231-50]|uniref:DUF4304 domain-containing protein n=1 Tax=Anderseniella sp. Alg231-50 TaxID=1922226 RepID=UPI000D557CE2
MEREDDLPAVERPPTLRALTRTVDTLLLPEGFNRSGVIWTRLRNTFFDVIDIQTSRYDHLHFTINVGVCDPQIFSQIWGRELPEKKSVTDCIVESRIGYISGQTDVWWDLRDQQAVNEVSRVLEREVIAFLEGQQNHKDMLDWLLKTKTLKQMYPLERIKVAVLYHSVGELDASRQMLKAELANKRSEHWFDRVNFVGSKLKLQLDMN